MMARRTIAVLLFAAVAPAAFAGFRASDLSAPRAFADVSARTALLANSMLGSESGLSRWLSFDSLNAQSFANVDLNADIGSPVSTIAPIPPLPSSGNLALVALASIGVYQAGRSLRKLNFAAMGHLPDWYHTGARSQIGNATPLPLDGRRAFVSAEIAELLQTSLTSGERVRFEIAESTPPLRLSALSLAVALRGPPLR